MQNDNPDDDEIIVPEEWKKLCDNHQEQIMKQVAVKTIQKHLETYANNNKSRFIDWKRPYGLISSTGMTMMLTALPLLTPLGAAASKWGHVDIVHLLLEKYGADIQLANEEGETALSLAVSGGGHIDMVKLLIAEKGANVDIADNTGWTPIMIPSTRGNIELLKLLIKHDCEHPPEIVELLLDNGALEKNIGEYNTAAMYASLGGRNSNRVEALLENGDNDINATNQEGKTTLVIIASLWGHPEMVEFLLKKGAGQTIVDEETKNSIDVCLSWSKHRDCQTFDRQWFGYRS